MITGFKYLFVIIAPLIAFLAGDFLYGSSHLISHHPCEQHYLGCLKVDFLSFALKGVLAGLPVGIFINSKKQVIVFACVSTLLISLATLRAASLQMEYLLDPYLIIGLPLPYVLLSMIGYFLGRFLAKKIKATNILRSTN